MEELLESFGEDDFNESGDEDSDDADSDINEQQDDSQNSDKQPSEEDSDDDHLIPIEKTAKKRDKGIQLKQEQDKIEQEK